MPIERTPTNTRVLLLAPTPRDAEASGRLLAAANILCHLCADLAILSDELRKGAAAIILPEEAVLSAAAAHLADTIARQPVWSDVPVIVLSRSGAESEAVERATATLGNVTLIERPVRVSTLVSVIRTALRARERQYQVRDRMVLQERAETALRESEERFRAAFDQAIVGIVLVDLQGRILRVNDAFCKIVGRSAEEMIGRDTREYTHPDDRSTNTQNIQLIQSQSVSSSVYEKRYFRPDGTTIWVQASLSPVRDRDGKIDHILAVVEDIDYRKRAREQLAQSEARLRLIFESVKDYAIFTTDCAGVITGWNIGAERIFGYSESEIRGQNSAVLFTREDREAGAIELEMQQALGEGHGNDERWHQRKDGSRFFASGLLMPLYDEEKQLVGFTKVCRDVTAARAAARELADTRARLEATLSAGEVGTWLWRIPENLLSGDDNLARLYNVNDQEIQGAPLATYLKAVHPEDREQIERNLRDVLESGLNFEMEYRLIQPDRSIRWVLARGNIERDAAGRALRLPGVVLDITERKLAEEAARESEARFRQLADSMPQIVWSARPSGEIDYYNQQWFDYTGLARGTAGIGEWSVSPDAETIVCAWRECVSTGKPFELECRLRRASDGAVRWHLARARPIRDGGGKIVRWFGTNTDIHDYKELQEQNVHLLDSERAARTEAERTSHMKDEFLATLSHELRTPLNAMLGWSQIMRSDSADAEDMAQGLEVIERNARAQAQIIEDLLDMSRIISGKVRLSVQSVDLVALVENALDTARPAAEAKGIELVGEISNDVGPIHADPGRLQQVLWNLLSNATKFTPRGGRVRVSLSKFDHSVKLVIADTGEGIKPEFLPYVFDRFRQADATTTRRHGGLGLGLSIVRQLIELHGGSIAADSGGVNKGTTFTAILPRDFILPVANSVPETKARAKASRAARSVEMGIDLSGVRIVAVDDEPDALALVKRLLEDYHADVRTASSAADAMRLMTDDLPNVLVSDIGMPGQDGYALIRQLRALPRVGHSRVHAVALTAYARAEDRAKAIDAGFDLHLSKPVEPSELLAAVAKLVRPVKA